MIQWGKNITSANDPLAKMETEDLFLAISVPSEELRSKIHQLRLISTLDKAKYRQLKTSLPYFVCGIFNPPYRRTENFGYIEHLVLDLDHLSEKGLSVNELKEKLVLDARIGMMFASPSHDGLKLMFSLAEKCYDHAKYSLFYKLFARGFAKEYNISQVVDDRTSDVTRACFLSIDEKAYHNRSALPLQMDAVVDFENTLEVKDAVKLLKEEAKEIPFTGEDKPPIAQDVFKEIRQRLNPNIRAKPDKFIYVPDELNNIMEQVTKEITERCIEVVAIESIHYGKKVKVKYQNYTAEVNIFFGKKGFSVVRSPKNGTHAELCEILYQIISGFLFTITPDDLPH